MFQSNWFFLHKYITIWHFHIDSFIGITIINVKIVKMFFQSNRFFRRGWVPKKVANWCPSWIYLAMCWLCHKLLSEVAWRAKWCSTTQTLIKTRDSIFTLNLYLCVRKLWSHMICAKKRVYVWDMVHMAILRCYLWSPMDLTHIWLNCDQFKYICM